MLKFIKMIIKLPSAIKIAYQEEKAERISNERKKAQWKAYFQGYGNFE